MRQSRIAKVLRRDRRTHDWLRARLQELRQPAYLLATYRGEYRPAPHPIKMRIVRCYLPTRPDFTFVETGTFLGDTIASLLDKCNSIVSIEINPELFARAKLRFSNYSNVECRLGDVAVELPRVLASLDRPAVFWLDAHWSGGITGRGPIDDPILVSLRQIEEHHVHTHTLLIDDARSFDGKDNRPDIGEIVARILAINQDYRVVVHGDIIAASLVGNRRGTG
jgi:hypothetical protein